VQPTVIADSHATKNDIINYLNINPDNVHVIHLAHDATVCYPEKNETILQTLGVTSPYVLYLAAIDSRKGIDVIIDAFAHVSRSFPEIKLVISGVVHSDYIVLTQQIQDFAIGKNVVFTGYVTDNEKRVLMSNAEVFLFPSKYEGFGLPILEAMACGCPVITSNTSSMPEVAGDACILINPYNAEELAHELERVLNSKMLRMELREKGFAQANKFSWDKTAEQTEAVFIQAMEG
jgi:glycosyltransferase involved in cell wall biosynthesis